MKKYLIRIGFFIFSIIISLFFLYSKTFWQFIEKLSNSEKGLLISLYNEISVFFQYSDAWNLIFIIIFISFSFLIWIVIEIFLIKIFSKIKVIDKFKNRKLSQLLKSNLFQTIFLKFISITILFTFIWLITNIIIIFYSNSRITNRVENIEKKDVLLLGTSKYLSDGKNINLYYQYRIDAVVNLYQANKIDNIIISGDKDLHSDYNEPRDMRRDLINAGIDSTIISLDYAGYRTLDSILRLASLFKTNNVIIVSQKFHIERALFQSFFYRINATGFQAKGTMTHSMFIRELLAKPKVILDLFFFNMQPINEKAYSRTKFSVSSDLHVIFLVLIIALVFSVFSLMGKLRLKVLYFSLGMLILTVIVVVKLYQKTIFTFFSDFSNAVVTSAQVFNQVMSHTYDSTQDTKSPENTFEDQYPELTAELDSLIALQLFEIPILENEENPEETTVQIAKSKVEAIEQDQKPEKKPRILAAEKTQEKAPEQTRRRRTSNSFNSINQQREEMPENPSHIFALVPRSKEVMHNSYIDVITQQDYQIDNNVIPKNTTISLLFTVDDTRMYFTSQSFYYKGKNLKVNLDAIELDSNSGIKLTAADRENIKEILNKEKPILFPSNYRLKIKCTYL